MTFRRPLLPAGRSGNWQHRRDATREGRPVERIWIFGAGHFGRRALQELARLRRVEKAVAADTGNRVTFRTGTAAQVLTEGLEHSDDPDWIVPAVPLHLAAAWYLTQMGSEYARRISVPREVEELVPGALRLPPPSADLYTSIAQTRCPEDCPEPASHCPNSGESRPYSLFSHLAELQIPGFTTVVIRSHQLAPGVGGYRPSALRTAGEQMKSVERKRVEGTGRSKSERRVLLCTACRCHGVITAAQRVQARE